MLIISQNKQIFCFKGWIIFPSKFNKHETHNIFMLAIKYQKDDPGQNQGGNFHNFPTPGYNPCEIQGDEIHQLL